MINLQEQFELCMSIVNSTIHLQSAEKAIIDFAESVAEKQRQAACFWMEDTSILSVPLVTGEIMQITSRKHEDLTNLFP